MTEDEKLVFDYDNRIIAIELALELFNSQSGSTSSIGATEKSKPVEQLINESKRIYKFIISGE